MQGLKQRKPNWGRCLPAKYDIQCHHFLSDSPHPFPARFRGIILKICQIAKTRTVFIFASPKFGVCQIKAMSTILISWCVFMLIDCISRPNTFLTNLVRRIPNQTILFHFIGISGPPDILALRRLARIVRIRTIARTNKPDILEKHIKRFQNVTEVYNSGYMQKPTFACCNSTFPK